MTEKKHPERALTQNEFITFKRMTELYLKTIRLVVNVLRQLTTGGNETENQATVTNEEAASLTEYCCTRSKRPLDLLVDQFDPTRFPPEADTSSMIYPGFRRHIGISTS